MAYSGPCRRGQARSGWSTPRLRSNSLVPPACRYRACSTACQADMSGSKCCEPIFMISLSSMQAAYRFASARRIFTCSRRRRAAVGTVQQERTACGGSGCGCPRDGEAQVCRKPSVGACLTTAVQPGARAQVHEALDGRAQVRPLEHVVPEHGGRAWVSQDVAVALQLLARRKAPVALWHGRRVRAVPTGGFGAAPCRRPRCGIGAAGCAGGGGRGGALAGAPGWSRCRGFR